MAGVTTPEMRMKAQDVFVENLVHAAASAPDMTLLLEPINQRDKPGYFYSTIEKKADIIRQIGASNVKIMFDAYHVGIAEGDIFTRLKTHLPLIAHVQIAAVPSRAEPDEGEIHYGNLINELDRLGYRGWVGCEYKPRAGTDEGLHWVQDLGARLY